MKIDIPWACDTCGIQKKPSNRWWMAVLQHNNDMGEQVVGVSVTEWEHGGDPELSDAHLCGESCVVQWLSKHVLGVRI